MRRGFIYLLGVAIPNAIHNFRLDRAGGIRYVKRLDPLLAGGGGGGLEKLTGSGHRNTPEDLPLAFIDEFWEHLAHPRFMFTFGASKPNCKGLEAELLMSADFSMVPQHGYPLSTLCQ